MTENLSRPYDVADMRPGVARPLTIDAVSTFLTTFFAKARQFASYLRGAKGRERFILADSRRAHGAIQR